MKSIYQKYRYLIFFFISCITALIPITWFDGKLIAGEEFYAINYARWGELFTHGWSSAVNYGEASMLISFKLQYLFFHFFELIGLSSYVALVVWHLLLWVLTCGGFYLLIYKIFGQKHSEILYYLAAVFYTFSPFFLNISPFLIPPRMVFALLPILFYLFVLYLEKKLSIFPFAFLVNLVLLIFSPIFVNLPSGAAVLILIFLFVTYHEVLVLKNIPRFFNVAFLVFVLFLLLNLWWLIPTAIQTRSSLGAVRATTSDFSAIGKSHMADIFTLFGSWAFREKIYNTDLYYFDFFKIYDGFPGIFFRFIPFVFVLLALVKFIREKNIREDKILLFSMFCVFIFLIFSKGIVGAGGDIFQFFYKVVPFFWIFREPYAKFIPIVSLCYALLLPVGFSYLTSFSKKPFVPIIGTFILGISVVYFSYPYINGDIVWDMNTNATRSYKVKIPENYSELSTKKTQGYFLQFPTSGFKSYYNWDSGYIGNPFILLSDMHMLNPESGYSPNTALTKIVNYLLLGMFNNPERFLSEASRFNVGGIVVQKDFLGSGYDTYFGKIEKNFKSFKLISNNNFDIYQFAEPAVIEVIENPLMFSVAPQTLDFYDYLKTIIDKEAYLYVKENSSDIYYANLNFDRNGKSAQASLQGKDYSYYVYDPQSTIENLKLDGVDVKGVNNKYVSSDDACCSKLELSLKELKPETTELPNNWIKTENSILSLGLSHPSSTLLFDTAKTSYMLPLENFDIKSNYVFQLNQSAIANSYLFFTFVEVDSARDTGSILLSQMFQTQDTQVNLKYSNIPPSYSTINASTKYYLTISYPSNLPLSAPLTINVKSLKQFKMDIPFVTAVKNSNTLPRNIPIEQKKVSESLYKIKIPSTTSNLVHFKQAYNSNWRLLEISEAEYNSAFVFPLKLRALFQGRSPENIEYYSNGWNVPESTSERYFALVFPLDIFASTFFGFTLCVVFIVALYLFLRKKWHY